jgi:ABC-2 type transport system ATP-binding protein
VSPAIEVEDVTRVFDSGGKPALALDHVSFAVGDGEIVGLLGSNGAGKTTLTKILSTLLLPTSGTARVLGVDVVRDPRRVRGSQSVVLGGDRGLYGQLSARENLRFFGMMAGLPHRSLRSRVGAALQEVGLGEAADRRVSAFSRGMRQRLHIAIGMISEPRILLLDEPTVGLDPAEAGRLREAIAALRERGVSVLLTSHYLVDVEQLADRVIMLDRGRVTHEMTVGQFTASAGYAAVVVIRGTGPRPDTARLGDAADLSTGPEVAGDHWTVSVRLRSWSAATFSELSVILADARVDDVEVRPVRLDDAFVRLQAGASR